jgi:hypothetical protein
VPISPAKVSSYAQVEQHFNQVLNMDYLDQQINQNLELLDSFEASLTQAFNIAYKEADDENARLLLHRVSIKSIV